MKVDEREKKSWLNRNTDNHAKTGGLETLGRLGQSLRKKGNCIAALARRLPGLVSPPLIGGTA